MPLKKKIYSKLHDHFFPHIQGLCWCSEYSVIEKFFTSRFAQCLWHPPTHSESISKVEMYIRKLTLFLFLHIGTSETVSWSRLTRGKRSYVKHIIYSTCLKFGVCWWLCMLGICMCCKNFIVVAVPWHEAVSPTRLNLIENLELKYEPTRYTSFVSGSIMCLRHTVNGRVLADRGSSYQCHRATSGVSVSNGWCAVGKRCSQSFLHGRYS